MSDVLGWIQTVGFPIVAYLLMYFRFEKKIDRLTAAIERLELLGVERRRIDA